MAFLTIARVVSDVSVLCPRVVVCFGNPAVVRRDDATSSVTGRSLVQRRRTTSHPDLPRFGIFSGLLLCLPHGCWGRGLGILGHERPGEWRVELGGQQHGRLAGLGCLSSLATETTAAT